MHGHSEVCVILQGVYPSAGIPKMWGIMLFSWYWSSQPCTSNLQRVYVKSTLGSVNLKIGMSKHTGANLFSFHHLLLWWQVPSASLAMEYPSESTPPQSGEEVGVVPPPSFMGQAWGFPLVRKSAPWRHSHKPLPLHDPGVPWNSGHSPLAAVWSPTHSRQDLAWGIPADTPP